MLHDSLIDRYKKLIPLIKYKKSKDVDEFNTPECVVCMEAFENNSNIRKIPSCRHIFHDECLMKWLSGAQQYDAQKCPMCNSDITVQILEKAIEEAANQKKTGFLGGVFGRASDKRQPPARPDASSRPSI